ncbi:MAG: ABC transporter permease [Clostridiales bacterium]|jgi:putative ABC transport system permease protein|nr:ABC transporter permease [Clostridiales bacterium]
MVMKKMFIRMLRELKGSIGQFWSMVFVIAAGSALFSGMFASQEAMTDFVENYFTTQNMADVWCYFKGITQDEINALFSADGVQAAEGRYAYVATVTVQGMRSELIIRSLTGINQSILSDGTMPENQNEIIVNNKYAFANNLSIGDSLPVKTDNGTEYLLITGFYYNPETAVIRKTDASPVSIAALGFAYGTNSTLIELNRSSPVFLSMLESINEKLEDGREQLSEADRQIMDAFEEYQRSKQEAETELANAQEKLEYSSQQIQQGMDTLASQKESAADQYRVFQTKLDETRRDLDETKRQAETEFADGKKALDDAKAEIAENQAALDRQRQEANIQIHDAETQIQDAAAKLEESREKGKAELAEAQTLLDKARETIDAKKAEFERQKAEAESQFADAEEQINAARFELDEKQRQGEAELAAARARLDDAKKLIDSGEAELNRGVQELAAGRKQLDEAAAQLTESERRLNDAYKDYQAARSTIPYMKRKEEDAKFSIQYDVLDQQKRELAKKQSEAEIQIAGMESLFASKTTELNAAKAEYEKGAAELATAKDAAMARLADAKAQIDSAQNELANKWDEAQVQIEAAKKELDKAESEYISSFEEFSQKKEDAENQLRKAEEELRAKQNELDAKREEAFQALSDAEAQITEANATYASKLREWNEKKADADRQFAEAEAEIESQRQEFDIQWKQAQRSIADMESGIAEARSTYEDGLNEFTEKKTDVETQIYEAESELTDKSQTIEEQKIEFEESESEAISLLETTVTSYQEVLLLTNNPGAAEELAKTNENFITAIERKNHMSYMAIEAAIDPIRSISVFFPVVFFLVAAIVAFISVSKMVDAQRVQISVIRALGVAEWKIQASFMVYALAAAILGTIGFAILGNVTLPRYFIGVFTTNLDVPRIDAPLYISYAVVVFLVAFLFMGGAVLLATRRVLSVNPAQGIRPYAPKKTKAVLLERLKPVWKRLNAIGKMTARGIFRNKARILLSSIGVTGSVALLVAVFSLKSMADRVVDNAINGIRYDLSVDYQNPREDKNDLSIPAAVEYAEWTDNQPAEIHLGDGVSMRAQIVESGSRMIGVFDISGNEIPFEDDSFIIPHTLAADYGLMIGDPLSVNINDTDYNFTITGVDEQAFSKKLYISMEAAEKAGLEIEKSVVLIKLRDSESTERIAEELRENDEEIASVLTWNNQIKSVYEVMIMINALIIIIALASSVLSVAVVYNIASVNIMDRSRDYAMVMALGYTVKQVNWMIVAENIFMTVFGAVAGTPLGYLLYNYLHEAVSRENLTPAKHMGPLAAVGAILASFLLMMVTNRLLRGKIYKIPLMETLKCVE